MPIPSGNIFEPPKTVIVDIKIIRSDDAEVTVRLRGGVRATLDGAKKVIESTEIAWGVTDG